MHRKLFEAPAWWNSPPPPAGGWSRDTRKQFATLELELQDPSRVTKLTFFNICRHHPTFKFKPHATDDERYVWGIDGVPLRLGMGEKGIEI